MGRTPLRLVASALLTAALAVGCGDDTAEDPSGPGNSSLGPAVGTAGGGATAGGTISQPGGGAAAPTAGGVAPTAGTGGSIGSAGNPTAGGSAAGGAALGGGSLAGTSNPGAGADAGTATGSTGGGSADTQWCKVKAIMDANCTTCHTTPPVAGAPFPLETFADLTAAHPTKQGKKVYERVAVRVDANMSQAENLGVMPPGKPLSADAIATINAWVAAGAPQGDNPTCAGSTAVGGTGPQADQTWPLPDCDAVYKIVAHGSGGKDSPYMVPAGQEIHPQVTWDAPWGNEEVQAVGFRAYTDNKKVLHHWILYANGGGFLTGWAPGEDGVKSLGPDVGMQMPKGAGSLRLDMHYYNRMGTTNEPDNSGVEICVVKKGKFHKNTAAVTMGLVGIPVIPANSTNFDVTGTCTVGGTTPVTLLSASPHAHTYARHMKFTLTKKNGQQIVMHDMPFMFGEQHSYPLDPPVVAEPGDKITTVCTYTNTTNQTVTFGENTGNEMCFNFALYYPAGALNCGGFGGLIGGGGGGLAGGFFGGN